MMDAIKVVYIASAGRSGSTLLNRLLASNNDGIAVGELNAIWKGGFLENQLCSCDRHFDTCEFWQAVVEDAFPLGLDVARILQLKRQHDRMRHISKLNSALAKDVCPETLAEYRDLISALYGSVAKISGSRVIYDSSKGPSTALVLNSIPGIDIFVIHLVRDPRGVVYSWMKKKQRLPDNPKLMNRYNTGRTIIFWLLRNYLIGNLKDKMPYQLVRYEDLAESPQEVCEAILANIGNVHTSLPFTDGNIIELDSGHLVSGNPVRFNSGPIKIKYDDAWSRELDPLRRMFTVAATLPMLRKYNYL